MASAAPKVRERAAVIDLGPADGGEIRQKIAAAIVDAGLQPVLGDGVEDALAGVSIDKDSVVLGAAMAEAQRAFGALDCTIATESATNAIGIAAARQAAGVPVPELPRAWAYVLLCADRAGKVDAAMAAAARLRTNGGSTEVPADVWAKYPDVDATLDREIYPLTITTDVPGAEIWIDFQRQGVSPLATFVSAGDHVIAAASETRRGWAAGKAVKTQTTLAVPMIDQAGTNRALAARVAGWHGAMPAPTEIGLVLDEVRARIVLIRRGDKLEAWGRIGRTEAPRKLGGEDGTGTLAEAGRLAALLGDRVQTWNDRAPDPDQPLLTEDPKDRLRRTGKADEPTRWWVYGAILGAVALGAGAVYLHDSASNTQRVELHYP